MHYKGWQRKFVVLFTMVFSYFSVSWRLLSESLCVEYTFKKPTTVLVMSLRCGFFSSQVNTMENSFIKVNSAKSYYCWHWYSIYFAYGNIKIKEAVIVLVTCDVSYVCFFPNSIDEIVNGYNSILKMDKMENAFWKLTGRICCSVYAGVSLGWDPLIVLYE